MTTTTRSLTLRPLDPRSAALLDPSATPSPGRLSSVTTAQGSP